MPERAKGLLPSFVIIAVDGLSRPFVASKIGLGRDAAIDIFDDARKISFSNLWIEKNRTQMITALFEIPFQLTIKIAATSDHSILYHLHEITTKTFSADSIDAKFIQCFSLF